MLLLLLVGLIVLGAFGAKWNLHGYRDDALSVRQTGAIRGFFALLILLSHMKAYLVLSTPGDRLFGAILSKIGQLMVTVFFFYSGYGIARRYRMQQDYDKGFLKHRIVKTWFHFAVAVALYAMMNPLIGVHYPVRDILLAFTARISIGDSCWFIFDTLLLYCLVLLTFGLIRLVGRFYRWSTQSRCVFFAGTVTLLSCGLILILRHYFYPEPLWYNTLLCFPVGVLLELLQKPICRALQHTWCYVLTGILLLAMFAAAMAHGGTLIYGIASCCFVLLITWLSMKLRFGNRVLLWFGRYSFFLYIYQRIPMNLMQALGIQHHSYWFALLSICAAPLLAWMMGRVQARLDQKLFPKENPHVTEQIASPPHGAGQHHF